MADSFFIFCENHNFRVNIVNNCILIVYFIINQFYCQEYLNGNIAHSVEKYNYDSVLRKNPALKTIKKKKSSYGYGTKIICDIARKYHGKYDFYEEDEFFCCVVE